MKIHSFTLWDYNMIVLFFYFPSRFSKSCHMILILLKSNSWPPINQLLVLLILYSVYSCVYFQGQPFSFDNQLMCSSLGKTISLVLSIFSCLLFFLWGWHLLYFPLPTLAYLLRLSLFTSCLGRQNFKKSFYLLCVIFSTDVFIYVDFSFST